jgi:hypothetical protein
MTRDSNQITYLTRTPAYSTMRSLKESMFNSGKDVKNSWFLDRAKGCNKIKTLKLFYYVLDLLFSYQNRTWWVYPQDTEKPFPETKFLTQQKIERHYLIIRPDTHP